VRPHVTPREELAGRFESFVMRRILERLARRPGLFVARTELAQYIWRDDAEGGPLMAVKVVDAIVYRERDRLAALGWAVHGMRGSRKGYRLVMLPLAGIEEPGQSAGR
jgi:hypothetical protein